MEQPKAGNKPVENISIPFDKPALLNEAKRRNKKCARDHKWGHAQRAIGRQDCQCSRQVGVFVWPYISIVEVHERGYCRESRIRRGVNDRNPNLVQNEMRSGRNYWFPRRSNRTKRQCVFYEQEADRESRPEKTKDGSFI